MNHHANRLRATRAALALVVFASGAAIAQPTGNPKGTVAPSETSAPKAGAAPRPQQPNMSGADGGKLVGTEAQTRARMQSARPQGSGTEGGLSSKQQGAATGKAGTQSDKGSAHARPLPPSR